MLWAGLMAHVHIDEPDQRTEPGLRKLTHPIQSETGPRQPLSQRYTVCFWLHEGAGHCAILAQRIDLVDIEMRSGGIL